MAMDGVNEAVGGAVDAVDDLSETAVDGGQKTKSTSKGGLFSGIGDMFEKITGGEGGGIGGILNGALDLLSSGGLGGMLNKGLDALGLPDIVGDVAGGVLDFCSGNIPGAISNGLDALEDVAASCGADEIAGFLEAGSEVSGMFTGGGLGAAGGAGGKAADLLGSAGESAKMLGDAGEVASSFSKGDIVGAGEQILGMTGADMGPLSDVLGSLSDESSGALGDVVSMGKEMLGGAAGASSQSGGEAPSRAALDAVGGSGAHGQATSLADVVGDFVSGAEEASGAEDPGAMSEPASGLAGGVFEAVKEMVGEEHPDTEALDNRSSTIQGALGAALGDPEGTGAVADMLEEAGSMSAEVDVSPHHLASMRG